MKGEDRRARGAGEGPRAGGSHRNAGEHIICRTRKDSLWTPGQGDSGEARSPRVSRDEPLKWFQ